MNSPIVARNSVLRSSFARIGVSLVVPLVFLLASPAIAAAASDLSISTSSIARTSEDPPIEDWGISLDNIGGDDAEDVSVEVTLPAEATFEETGSSLGCSAVDTLVTCTIGTIVAAGTEELTIRMSIPGPSELTTYYASATAMTSTADDPEDNNSTITEFEIIPDLELSGNQTSAYDVPSAVEWTFQIGNGGGSNAENTEIEVTIPDAATLVGASSSPGCSEEASVVTCPVGSVAPGDTSEVIVLLSVPVPATRDDYDISAVVTTTSLWEPTENNNLSSGFYVVAPGTTFLDILDLGGSEIEVNGAGTQSVRVYNSGPNIASGVTISLTLPTGIGYTSVVGATCTPLAQVLTCDLPDIAVDDSSTVVITLSGPVAMPLSPYINIAGTVNYALNYGGAAVSLDLWNTIIPEGSVNVKLKKTNTNSGTVVIGGLRTYSYKVTNYGPNTATGVNVSIPIPAGSTYVSYAGAAICTYDNDTQTVTCALSDIAVDAVSLPFSITMSHDALGLATIVASVGTNEVDWHSNSESWSGGDNSLYRYANVIPVNSTDVGIYTQWQDNGGVAFVPGTQDTLVATAHNYGPISATGVELSVPIPTGYTYDDATSSPECSQLVATVTCASPAGLATGEEYAANIKLQVPNSLGASTIAATVSSDQTDWNDENNSASLDVLVSDGTLVDVTSRVYPFTANNGVSDLRSGVEFRLNMWAILDYRNVPLTDTTDTVEITLPDGVTFLPDPVVEKYPANTSCSVVGNNATCSLTASGDAINELNVTLRIIADEPGTYQFTSLGTTTKSQWTGHEPDTWQVSAQVLAGSTQDACTNITGFQAAVPDGYTAVLRVCTLTPTDQCPNLSGAQLSVPTGMVLFGGACIGTATSNTFTFGGGSDTFDGGAGNDIINGGGGNDSLTGGIGFDTLNGNGGSDKLNGGIGNDKLNGGSGKDKLNGNTGNDSINANDHKPGDVIDCGAGVDKVTLNRGDKVKRCEKITRK